MASGGCHCIQRFSSEAGGGGEPESSHGNTTLHGIISSICLQCFDTVGWAAGRASSL